MKEITFLKQNAQRWEETEKLLTQSLNNSPDKMADQFIELTDDLAYAQTNFPNTTTTAYLNGLTATLHQELYKNKKEKKNRIITFWKLELPYTIQKSFRPLLYSFCIFTISAMLGALSSAYDDNFVRVILGDTYVNMTLENIENGDPMAVYKKMGETEMFLGITSNNIRVSFFVFVAGAFFSLGAGYLLFYNGIMMGAFQYFFYSKGLLTESALVIWIHGTLEISAIIIAGAAGIVMGNSILFPGTFSRSISFMKGAKKGIKIVIGLMPIFILAGLLESFVTRHTGMPLALSLFIILSSLSFIIGYFIIYPLHLNKKIRHATK